MMCFPVRFRTVFILVIFCSVIFPARAFSVTDPYSKSVKYALQSLKSGAYEQAARGFDEALDLNLNATPARDGLALTLLLSGQTNEAKFHFSIARKGDSSDAVSRMGLALCALASGDLNEAGRWLQLPEGAAPLPHADAVQAYIQYLTSNDVTVTDNLPLEKAIKAGVGKPAPDTEALEEIAKSIFDTRFDDRPGLYASFNSAAPLASGRVVRIAVKARKPAPPGKASSGRVILQAQLGNRTDITYVQFMVDNRVVGITNTQPYRYEWDTTRYSNGEHTLVITGYDRDSLVVAEHTRTIRVYNENSKEPTWEDFDLTDAFGEMLSLMIPQPSSKVIHYWLGKHYSERGEREKAAASLEYTVAVDPDYQDARRLLIQAYAPLKPADSIWSGPRNSKAVAITFDDGPNPETTPLLLDVLKNEGIPVTFFLVGWRAQTNPDLVSRMVQEGHALANHSFTHPKMTDLTAISVEKELIRTTAVVREITGKRMDFFRPPGGHIGPMVYDMLRRYGIRPVFWTVNCTKMQGGSPDAMAEYVLNQIGDGGIILMHNAETTTVHALPLVVRGLQRRGLKIVTMDEMMSGQPPVLSDNVKGKQTNAPLLQPARSSKRTPNFLRAGRNRS